MTDKASIRHHIERIDGVSATWFEWTSDGELLSNVLVVEVDFDTDPNAGGFRRNVLDAIVDTAKGVLTHETAMIVSDLRIVPKRQG